MVLYGPAPGTMSVPSSHFHYCTPRVSSPRLAELSTAAAPPAVRSAASTPRGGPSVRMPQTSDYLWASRVGTSSARVTPPRSRPSSTHTHHAAYLSLTIIP